MAEWSESVKKVAWVVESRFKRVNIIKEEDSIAIGVEETLWSVFFWGGNTFDYFFLD